MKKLYTFLIFMISFHFYGQNSSISGTVLDESTGRALPGVNVKIKDSKSGTTTDSDGKFVFRNVAVGTFEVEFTYYGYGSKAISEVITKANEITYLNTSLSEKKNELKEVVITRTKAKTESIKSLLIAQKNSITVSDGISAESMKRTPDKTTSDVLKRVSGVSIQDNKFVVIRGLNDRYNAAFLNGGPLPSSESDRKAFSFDIFPANMLDNLVITKTASPDMPGEFAGGVIQITTKAVPDKNFQSFSYGTGYNTVTTFKTQKDYKGGKTDWLGIDDGTRKIPSSIPSSEEYRKSFNGSSKAIDVAKSFETDWNITNSRFDPNSSFQYSIGHHFDFGKKVFGVLFSVSHSLSNTFTEVTRNEWDNGNQAIPSVIDANFSDNIYSQQILSGAIANFSMKFNENHNLSFKNILSINSNDLVLEKTGKKEVFSTRVFNSDVRWFTSNIIYSGQLNGEHYFAKPKIKVNWNAFYSNINRSIPNLRRNLYLISDPNSTNPADRAPEAVIGEQTGSPDYGGSTFFADNKEKINGGKIDLSKKLDIGKDLINEVKIGFLGQNRARDFSARYLYYNQYKLDGVFDRSLLLQPESTIYNSNNMGVLSPGRTGFTLFDGSQNTDKYDANSQLNAGYIMLDNRYKKFRLIWGIRAEEFAQKLNSIKISGDPEFVNVRNLDFLPSANLIFSINNKQNLRLSYSKTVNRPEYRELAPFAFYDFTTQFFTQGNKDLVRSTIQNFDFRYEFYPSKGQLLTLSYFLKKFEKPIEVIQQVNKGTISYGNANKATNSGIEMEFRVLLSSIFKSENETLWDDFTLFSNVAVIKSEADVKGLKDANVTEESRPLQGQSPYVFNAGLMYMNKDNGWTISTNVNRAGNRISITSSENEPAIWEKGRTMLDFQLAKSFNKNKLELKLNIQNILAQDQIFYQNNYKNTAEYGAIESMANQIFTGDYHYQDGYNAKDDDLFWLYKFGSVFSVSATYNF